jgi:hypothetical protein
MRPERKESIPNAKQYTNRRPIVQGRHPGLVSFLWKLVEQDGRKGT